MSNNISKDDFDDLKKQIGEIKDEFKVTLDNQNLNPVAVDPVEKIFSGLLNSGTEIFSTWIETNAETSKYETDKENEIRKYEIDIKQKIDINRTHLIESISRRNIFFKSITIGLVVAAIVILSILNLLSDTLIVLFTAIITLTLKEDIFDFSKYINKGLRPNSDNEK